MRAVGVGRSPSLRGRRRRAQSAGARTPQACEDAGGGWAGACFARAHPTAEGARAPAYATATALPVGGLNTPLHTCTRRTLSVFPPYQLRKICCWIVRPLASAEGSRTAKKPHLANLREPYQYSTAMARITVVFDFLTHWQT